MIAVIVILQFLYRLLMADALVRSNPVNAVTHKCHHLLLSDAAHRRIFRKHADILYVVQFAEDAQLGEFRYARQEHEPQIRVTCLQRTVEVTHHISELRQVLLLVDHIQQWRIVLVNEDNNLLPGLTADGNYQIRKAVINIHLSICHTELFFLTLQLVI